MYFSHNFYCSAMESQQAMTRIGEMCDECNCVHTELLCWCSQASLLGVILFQWIHHSRIYGCGHLVWSECSVNDYSIPFPLSSVYFREVAIFGMNLASDMLVLSASSTVMLPPGITATAVYRSGIDSWDGLAMCNEIVLSREILSTLALIQWKTDTQL